MPRRISERVDSIKPSGIRRFFDLVMGRPDVISLGVGEPDFPVPWRIRDEMIYSLEKGITSYTSNHGLRELREEIAEYYKKFRVDGIDPDNVIITTGVSEGIDIALRAILNPGEGVLIPEPAYVSYKPLTILAGGEAIPIPTTPTFELDCDALRRYAEDAKAIVLNYPNNPTGVSYSKKELEEVADLAIEYDLVIISDEIYAELTYSERHVSIASLDGMEERTVILNGFSKAFAMTGFRIGYAIAPEDIANAMLKIHQYCMLCAPITAQIGALEALRGCEEELERIRAEYMRRRNLIYRRLKDIFELRKPDGAFYVFPKIDEYGLSSEEFAERLLMEKGVAVVPGNAFGECGEGYVRCAYAVGMEKLREALDRIEDFVRRL